MDNKPQWSDWYWGDHGIFRHRYSDWKIEEECSDCVYLKQHLEPLHRLKQELIDRAAQAKGSRKREFEQGIKSKESQIEYVSKRLELLNSPSKLVANHQEESAVSESVAVEVVEELSSDEQRDRLRLERRVERSAFEGSEALRELRDRRLFRSTHKTFEKYIKERFGYSRYTAYNRIVAADVVNNLLTNGQQILPTSERQAREVAKVKDLDLQREVWQQAVEKAGGKVPSNRIVKDVVSEIKEAVRRRANIPCPFQAGEVCQIWVKENPDLRGLESAWCIVEEIREFTILVQTWRGEFIVKEENLKSLGFVRKEQDEFRTKISDRIKAVYPICKTHPLLLNALKGYSKYKFPVLDSEGEELLQSLEKICAKRTKRFK